MNKVYIAAFSKGPGGHAASSLSCWRDFDADVISVACFQGENESFTPNSTCETDSTFVI